MEILKPPEFRQISQIKKAGAELVKSARNPPEIGNQPEIFFARKTTFKSARIVQIWRRKPPSGNAVLFQRVCLSVRLLLEHEKTLFLSCPAR
jgi:hypothetical protein